MFLKSNQERFQRYNDLKHAKLQVLHTLDSKLIPLLTERRVDDFDQEEEYQLPHIQEDEKTPANGNLVDEAC